MIFSILLTWILFIPVAFINGFIREKYIKKFVKDLPAHQISTITLSAAFVGVVYIMMGSIIRNSNNQQLLFIGFAWVGLTILFEFGFGHYINKTPWRKLLADYNIIKGRIWGLFLLIEMLSPFIVRGIV